jgi:aspartyl-tRNA(Asn)/glutamyl-tRNA(Gln) amidotransferase subunit C
MKVTAEEIKKLAQLAKLELKTSEITKLADDLGEVISYVSEIKEVDTSYIKSKFWEQLPQNVSRQDEVSVLQGLTTEEALSNAKNTKNNLFVVPKVLNKENV